MTTVPSKVARSKPLVSISLVAFLCLLIVSLRIGPNAINVVGGFLCVWALLGPRQAIEALSLGVIIKYLNPSVFSFSPEFGLITWVLLIVAGLRLLLSASWRHLRLMLPLLAFSSTIALLMLFQSNRYLSVSAMKLLTFTYGASVLLAGYAALKEEDAKILVTWFFSLVTTVVLLSLSTFAFPSVAYARTGGIGGFQGILSHPQTFGPILAPIVCWLLASMLYDKGTKIIKPGLIVLLLLGLMIMSKARTSVVMVVLSLIATYWVVFFGKKRFPSFRIGRTLAMSLSGMVVLAIGLVSSTALRGELMGFIFKYQATNIDEALISRSGGIESQWHSFLQSPVFGHGFGIYPWGDFPSGVVEVMGIPISAPVEKGFLPTAILEEIGLIGALAFLLFIVWMGKRAARQGDVRWLAVFFACIFVNVGEMVFFSVGGIGLFYWLLLGLSMPQEVKTEGARSRVPSTIPSRPVRTGPVRSLP